MIDTIFLIDGVRFEHTPGQLLSSLRPDDAPVAGSGPVNEIVDETPEVAIIEFPSGAPETYLDAVRNTAAGASLVSPEAYGRLAVSEALLRSLRSKGSFKFRDLALTFSADWHVGGMGEASAFYRTVGSVCDYADALGLQIYNRGAAEAGGGQHLLSIGTVLAPPASADIPEPYRSSSPRMFSEPLCPDVVIPDPLSWVIYVPFDSAAPRLGGSLLSQSLGGEFDSDPQTGDADYFIDCFEVVRELVEDGVAVAARVVGRGGLLPALDAFCREDCGLDADISDLMGASGSAGVLRVLYSELPGVLVQIRDADFDYADAELLLQDVAYYPLGHPSPLLKGVKIRNSGKSGIQTILDSLIRNAEGED